MSWHMLGTQYEHAGAPDDGPCPSCEVVRLRAEVARAEAALADLRRRSIDQNLALTRDLAALREGARKGWDANVTMARELERARALREIAGKRNCQLLEQRDEARALLAAWVDWSHPGAMTVGADTRAFLDRRRDDAPRCTCGRVHEACGVSWPHVHVPDSEGDRLMHTNHLEGCPARDACECPVEGHNPGCERDPLVRARDEARPEPNHPRMDRYCCNEHEDLRDEPRRCTCVPHSGDCELRRDEGPKR